MAYDPNGYWIANPGSGDARDGIGGNLSQALSNGWGGGGTFEGLQGFLGQINSIWKPDEGSTGLRVGINDKFGSGEEIYNKLGSFKAIGDTGSYGDPGYLMGRPAVQTSGANYRDLTGPETSMYQQYANSLAAKNDSEFDFGNVLLAAAMAGVGGLAAGAFGGEGLASAFSNGTAAGAGGAWNGAAGVGALGAEAPSIAASSGSAPMEFGGWNSGGNVADIDWGSYIDQWSPASGADYSGGAGADWSGSMADTWSPASGADWSGLPTNTPGMPQLTDLLKNAPPGTQSALMKMLSGGGSSSDMTKLLGQIAPGLLAAYGSSQAGNAQAANVAQARADRQPSLDYYNKLLAMGPEGFAAGEGSQAVKGVLQGLSAKFGNPIGSGTALQLATDAALSGYGNRLTQAAGPAGLVSGTGLLNAQNAADTTGAGMYTGLSSALGGALAPQSDLASLLAQLKGSGLNLTGSGLT